MTFRSEKYRRLVAAMPCAFCQREGRSQAAHSNAYVHGKGRGLKASDAAIFPLCADEPGRLGCHTLFDTNRLFTGKDAAREGTYRLISDTMMKLLETGELVGRKR